MSEVQEKELRRLLVDIRNHNIKVEDIEQVVRDFISKVTK